MERVTNGYVQHRLISVAVILVILVSPLALVVYARSTKQGDEITIKTLEHEWLQAIKTHDYAWFERNFASDCTEVSSGDGALKSKAQDIADFKADKTIFEVVEFDALNIRVDGNAAIATGITHIIARDDQGQTFDVRLRFTDTWIKRAGRWQVWAAQHTRIRP